MWCFAAENVTFGTFLKQHVLFPLLQVGHELLCGFMQTWSDIWECSGELSQGPNLDIIPTAPRPYIMQHG